MEKKKLFLMATDESPQVHFDPQRGIIDIAGKSLPEDVEKFYAPLLNLAKEYVQHPQLETTINFDMTYLNSSSTKKVLEIVTLFEPINKGDYKIKINWYYDEYDEDMEEEGKDFARLTHLPLTLIVKKQS